MTPVSDADRTTLQVDLFYAIPVPQFEFLISDTTATAVRAYHEVNCDISNLKVMFIHRRGGRIQRCVKMCC